MKQLGFTDSIFVSLETRSAPQHVAFLGIYDPSTATKGLVRFKDVLSNFEHRLHALPHFRMRLVQVPGRLDLPYWAVDDDFDVEFHIRHLSLPQPGDWRQLCIQASRLHSRSLDMNRPLWECYVIEGLNNVEGCSPGSFAVYLKMHHSLVDGDLGQRIMTIIHDLEPYPEAGNGTLGATQDNDDKEFSGPRLGNAELVTRAFANRIRRTLPFMRSAAGLMMRVGDTAAKIARRDLPAPAIGPKTRFDEPVGMHRVFDGLAFPLAEIKEIKNATNTTINDVCMAVVSGGLRKYLQHHADLPDESLVVNVPVNMRKRGSSSGENNQIAALMPRLRTDIEDPVERLHAIQLSMDDAKKFIGTPISEPLKLVGLFPPFLAKPLARMYAAGKLTRYLPAGTPCVVTNVPGPQMDLYANGAKLVKMHCLGLLTPGVGLFNAIFTHGGQLTLSVLGDRDQMPDPSFYAQCLQESYDELRDAVLAQAPARKRRVSVRKRRMKSTAKA